MPYGAPGGTGTALTQYNPQLPAVQAGMRVVRPILWVQQYPGGFKGFRKNKSTYFRVDPSTGQTVRIPAGSTWVKRRTRNPQNSSANSRAMSRLEAAKRSQKDLNRVTIRPRK